MRFLKAGQLFDGKHFLALDTLLVLNSKNEVDGFISEKEIESNRIQRFEGIICPGFVNTHCHLELSHLRNLLPQKTGLVEFAKNIVTHRCKFSDEQINECMKEADIEMWRNGIVVVGDICNNNSSFITKAESKIHYFSFIELIGLNPNSSNEIFESGLGLKNELGQFDLRGALCPHAPYSVSFPLLEKLALEAEKYNHPLSIHNQESKEEINFLEGKPSDINKLYDFLGIDISWFKAPMTSGLDYLKQMLKANPNIFVHNTFSSVGDLLIGPSLNAFWCFCPGANVYIENRLPNYENFKNLNTKICLGTDSLASNQQLDLLKEANLILKNTDVFSMSELLCAMTSQGAQALGLGKEYGSFIIGKNSGLNLVDFNKNQFNFIQKIS